MAKLRPLIHVLPLLATGSLGFAVWSVARTNEPRMIAAPPIPPAAASYPRQVAGRGIIEPASEIVAVASELNGIVTRVAVRPGDEVEAGAPLFMLDDRSYRAALAEAEADVLGAMARLAEIERQTALQRARIEEVAAEVAIAEAEFVRAVADRERYRRLERQDFASRQRFEAVAADALKAEAGRRRAQAALVSAREQLAVLDAGRQRVEAEHRAELAAAERARVKLDKTVIRAPLAGTVLSVDIRRGERSVPGDDVVPIRLGLLRPLHIRIDIDEADAWRVVPGAPARAQLSGNSAIAADLGFVRLEPYVRPKQNLASGSAERVDTRVLQVIYAVDPASFPARVGQQVDVFIAATEAPQDVPLAEARP